MEASRAQVLRRKAQGRRLLPGMREFLRGVLGHRGDALELASWEESDATNKVFERERASARAALGTGVFSIEGTCRSTVLEYIAERRGDLPVHEELLLFHPSWYACGAVKIDIGEALDAAERLVRLDQEDLLACNTAGTVGLVFEWFYDNPRGETMYRFLAWNRSS